MSTRGGRELLRGYQRRKNLDLNVPPVENRDLEGTSTHDETQDVQACEEGQPLPPTTIDVEALDDDVVESSPTAFAEAKSKRNRERTDIVVVESDERASRHACNNRNRRRRAPQKQAVINCELINLESGSNSMGATGSAHKFLTVRPPQQPKEPTFSCPICMGPLSEEMSTKCGHIFCKGCIKAAIAAQGKCPTCRKRVTVKELIRVFLPAAS